MVMLFINMVISSILSLITISASSSLVSGGNGFDLELTTSSIVSIGTENIELDFDPVELVGGDKADTLNISFSVRT